MPGIALGIAPGIALGVALGLAPSDGHAAPDALPTSCIRSMTVLPLLGGAGDGPLIAAKIDGRDVAMYVDFAFGEGVWIRQGDGLALPTDGPNVTVTENEDHISLATLVALEGFSIGLHDFGRIQAVLMPGHVSQLAGGLPVAGVIDGSPFEAGQVVLDMPQRKLIVLRLRDRPECEGAVRDLMGPQAHVVPMRHEDHDDMPLMPVTIDGQERDFYLDTDMSANIVPQAWSDLPELAPDRVARGAMVVTHYAVSERDTARGHRVALDHVRIGDQPLPGFSVLVEDRTQNAMLGLPFFENHIVLLDYRHDRIWFGRAPALKDPPGHHLHFEQNVEGHASVAEQVRRQIAGSLTGSTNRPTLSR